MEWVGDSVERVADQEFCFGDRKCGRFDLERILCRAIPCTKNTTDCQNHVLDGRIVRCRPDSNPTLTDGTTIACRCCQQHIRDIAIQQ